MTAYFLLTFLLLLLFLKPLLLFVESPSEVARHYPLHREKSRDLVVVHL